MKVSFYLLRPSAKEDTAIYARLCYAGYKVKYYITESINPKFWNKDTNRAKETQKFREYPEFNARLNHIEALIKSTYRRYLNDNGAIPLPENLKPLLDKAIKNIEQRKDDGNSFFKMFRELRASSEAGTRVNLKTGKPLSNHTVKTYKTVYTHLESFQKTYKRLVNFDTIDLDFYADYMEYLVGRKLTSNTIGKHFQIIKTIIAEASEKGIKVNPAYKSRRFTTLREKTDSIFLSEEELQQMEQLDLSDAPWLEKVRDLFLVGCYTGLRFSDFSALRPEHIRAGLIEITQAKTTGRVAIPVHPVIDRILKKYGGVLPKALSNQKMNDHLKIIGQRLECLHRPFSKTFTKGGAKVSITSKRWEVLTTHTARRSFATNEYLAGTPTVTIMAITGHKSERTFLGYIKLAPSEHAKLLNLHWEKRSSLKAI